MMGPHLLVVGVSHRTAPLSLRERLAVASRDLPETLSVLRAAHDLPEVVLLSTCNRVECYASVSDAPAATRRLVEFFAHLGRLEPTGFAPHLYHLTDREAVEHLFRVAGGLDSMILGESEIVAQLKVAYEIARTNGATDASLNRLFQKAFHSAKVIRSRTGLGQGQASIGSVVVRLTTQLFGERLAQCEALLWGAGKAAETTVRHLMKAGIGGLWIVNRTQSKAEDLACACQGRWLAWEQACKHLAHVDIAIVGTQAPHYVIDAADLATVLPQRGGRPLVIVDLAVPRNVDPAIARAPGVRLANIDHLQGIAQEGLAQRTAELGRCEALIREQVASYWRGWERMADKEALICETLAASLPV